MRSLRIGTRGSKLALAQSAWVQERIEERFPGARFETVLIKTSGDQFIDTSVQAIGGKGVFVKEIEEALLRGKIDLAVHSMKDLPTETPLGLTLAAVPEREDPRDVLVSRNDVPLNALPAGARVGTGSLRRKAQILHHRPELIVAPVRGNIDTRLKKLAKGDFDAIVLAAAGLRRIGHEGRITEFLSPQICLSAVAQGALALECREDDPLCGELSFLHHRPTYRAVTAERSFLGRLGGGCHVPVGALAITDGESLKVLGVVADVQGRKLYRGESCGPADQGERLGRELAESLLAQGAEAIMGPIRGEDKEEPAFNRSYGSSQ